MGLRNGDWPSNLGPSQNMFRHQMQPINNSASLFFNWYPWLDQPWFISSPFFGGIPVLGNTHTHIYMYIHNYIYTHCRIWFQCLHFFNAIFNMFSTFFSTLETEVQIYKYGHNIWIPLIGESWIGSVLKYVYQFNGEMYIILYKPTKMQMDMQGCRVSKNCHIWKQLRQHVGNCWMMLSVQVGHWFREPVFWAPMISCCDPKN